MSRWPELLLEENAPLVAELCSLRESERLRPNLILGLRKRFDPELVRLALALAEARERGRKKFTRVAELLSDVEGMQVASDQRCAGHKAARFRALGCEVVYELCCGIGGDAMAYGPAIHVVLVDQDEDRLAMAKHNVSLCGGSAETLCMDVADFDASGKVLHLDPSRRYKFHGETRRSHRYREYRPGPKVIERILAEAEAACVKLGPHVEREELALSERELEILFDSRSRLQALLWTGALASRPGKVHETELAR
ncbi:MAG: hypothetical protein CSA62_02095 [Planctomycetota bacterium]|nr:MAG: hypothetical protein CSA62_02095 [Planctomycetota bacterium]